MHIYKMSDAIDTSGAIPSIIFIVPYRDREQQQQFFANHMKTVMEDVPDDAYKIWYIHQCDTRGFNRGALKNIGFLVAKERYPNDYQNITFVFNDVDTMPFTKNFLKYETNHGRVKHFYGFKFALGGIVSIKGADFERINGYPNFWAWGFEDNSLQKRVLAATNLMIDRDQFYPLLDKNILQLNDGITRNVNRTEFDKYIRETKEGWNTIRDISYTVDETTGFINVERFSTGTHENVSETFAYDLRKGNSPFKVAFPPGKRRGATMGMTL